MTGCRHCTDMDDPKRPTPRTYLPDGIQLDLPFMGEPEPEQLELPFLIEPDELREQSSGPPGKPVPEKYDGG